MSKTVDGIKMATKALRATRKRLESIEDVQTYHTDTLNRIETTLGTTKARTQAGGVSGLFAGLAEGLTGPKSVMGELSAIRSVQENHQSATLNQLRDIKSALRPDAATIAGVMAKLDRIVPEVQGINGGLGKVRADLISAVRDLTGNAWYLRTDVGAVHDRQAETYDLLKAVRADVGTIRSGVNELEDGQRQARAYQSSGSYMPILAAIRDGIKALRADVVDVAAEASDDVGQRIDRLTERLGLFEQQERHIGMRLRDEVAGISRMQTLQTDSTAAMSQSYGLVADRLKTLLDRQERVADRDAGEFAALVKYLEVIERKLDALSVEVSELRQAQEES